MLGTVANHLKSKDAGITGSGQKPRASLHQNGGGGQGPASKHPHFHPLNEAEMLALIPITALCSHKHQALSSQSWFKLKTGEQRLIAAGSALLSGSVCAGDAGQGPTCASWLLPAQGAKNCEEQ